MLLEMLSTLSAGLFAGAAIYISLVEHPARLECGTSLAITEFAPSYRRAAVMQGLGSDWIPERSRSLVHGLLVLVVDWRHYSPDSYSVYPYRHFPYQ